jgi:hypothetical protein
LDPHPNAAELTAFDSGQLPAAERQAVEQHVRQCPDCCRTLDRLPEDSLAAVVRAFAGGPSSCEPPAALAGHPRYRLLEVLGRGGMGVVYKAVHRLMDRVVALKIIDQRLTDRPAFVERFRREVKAAARLAHPNIVTAYDADQAGDTHFLVMEHVAGISLDRELQRRGPLPVAEACDIVRQAALGLQHAHEHGMVHRDVKPANLLRTPDCSVKILDFGLAHVAGEEATGTTAPPSATVVGTPDYLAPEQARDPHRADIRADIYSLGCTLYHLLVGLPPFPGGTPVQKLLAHQERLPMPVTEARGDVPAALAAAVQRMLAKEPAQRYQSPAEVARDLAPWSGCAPLISAPAARTGPRRRLPLGLTVGLAAAVLSAATAAGALVLWREPREQPGVGPAPPPAGPADTPARGPLPEVRALRQGPLTIQELRDEAVAWVRSNCRWGPGHRLVADSARDIDSRLHLIGGFQLGFGPLVLKSARATLLAGHPGGLFVVELPDWLAREGQLEGTKVTFIASRRGSGGEVRPANPRVWLSALAVSHADHLDAPRVMTGTLAYRVGSGSPGRLGLRRTVYWEQYRRVVVAFPEQLQSTTEGVLSFTLPSIANADVQPRGPLLVFVEVSRQQGDHVVIESNTVAALVNVTAAP